MAHLAIDGVEPFISTDTGPRHAVIPFGETRPETILRCHKIGRLAWHKSRVPDDETETRSSERLVLIRRRRLVSDRDETVASETGWTRQILGFRRCR